MSKGKWTAWILLCWVIAGYIMAFFDRPIVDALWVLAGFLLIAWFVIGVVLAIASLASAYLNKSYIGLISAVGFILFGILITYQTPAISAAGNDFIVRYRFNQNINTYREIVAQLENGSMSPNSGIRDGVSFEVDQGPPLRVAFPQPGGILDNWEGIVYDPTGEVLKARGWTENGSQFAAPPGIVNLFGGDIVSCSPIEGNYYRCWFT